MKFYLKHIFFFTLVILQASCGFKVSTKGANSSNIISGVISPLIGSIADDNSFSLIFQTANAVSCSSPVYVKLYAIKTDGSIDENIPLISQKVGADARYSFDTKSLGISKPSMYVEFLVKAEGCNGEIYKRPITNFDSSQDLDAKSTVVAEVVNAASLLNKTLNEVSRAKVELLINTVTGNSTSAALISLTTQLNASTQFTEIFGTSPSVIQNARPEVNLSTPTSSINELAISSFTSTAFHVDPTYSAAYVWKLDGVVKSTNSTWNFIPTANDSGNHSIDLYVGKDNGSGEIDLTKPYYTKNFSIIVNNNILPTPPNISLNSVNPNPVNSNSVIVDLATGVSLANCASFSHLAITDTSTPPGIMQFNIDCNTSGTQEHNVIFSSGDGSKTLFIWAIDNEGNISNAKTVSLILDTQPPVASLSFAPTFIRGGSTQFVSFSASDAGVGLNTLDLYFSTNGGISYTLLSHLTSTDSTYSWSVPNLDTVNAKIKFVVTDLTSSAAILYSNLFTIDSIAPIAPTIALTSAIVSNSTSVTISATCLADYDKIYYSQTSTAPAESDINWETCNTTKNFTVTSGDGIKNIYSFTKDIVGNISASSNITMTLDTNPPSTAVASLASNTISSSSAVTFTITDCLDRSGILVSESIITPASNDSNWQVCSTSPGAIGYTLVGPILQDIHNLYIYAKDSVGNISSPTSVSMIYDTTNPTLNLLTTLATHYRGGDSIALNISSSDTNGLLSLKLYYAIDGSNYTFVNNIATSANSYTWSVPSDNTSIAKLKFLATDNAISANSSIVYSNAFTIDSIAPTAPVISRSSAQYSQLNAITINTICSADYFQILYSESPTTPNLANPNWETCGAVKTFTTSTDDGLKTIYAFTRDIVGNISTSSNVTMTLDTTLPTLSIASMNTGGNFQGGITQNIIWTASDVNLNVNPISILYSIDGVTYTIIASNIANSGTYSWVLPSIDNSTVTYKISATDFAGNIKSAISDNFTIDTTPPVVDILSINGGAATTTNNNIQISLSASDSTSPIKYFCLKYDNPTQPAPSDSCWKDVTAPIPGITVSKNISFSNFYYQIGFTKGSSVIYAWVKDNAGKISTNSSIQNKDMYSIYFDPGTPPEILALQVTNTNAPANPILSSDLTSTTGSDIYIKWNAIDAEGLDTVAPINIQYTTNDTNFINLSGGSNLTNGANGACTVDPGFSGCAKLISPASGYFKIRVIAKDALGTTVFLNSSPMNEMKIKILAGNTDDGLNGSALSAIFNVWGSQANNSYGVKNRLAVSEDGKFFYVDTTRGLLWIDPNTGVLKKFLDVTGTSSGDGGNVSLATLKQASAIAIDSTNNLLIWDFDRIRKVNLNTMIITTIIGGGASADPLNTVSATTLNLNGFDNVWGTFIPLPNGDIIFTSPSGSLHQRRFRAIDNKVELMDIQGSGYTNYPSDIWNDKPKIDMGIVFDTINSQIKFMAQGFYKTVVGDSWSVYSRIDFSAGNESTPYPGIGPYDLPFIANSLFTGLDGNLYFINRFRTALYRYNYLTNTSTLILGNGANSATPCVENSVATSCPINIDSVFISKIGRIYFVDNGVIRTIDDNNKVLSLYGQFPSFGNGGLATTARFGQIMDINMGKSTPVNNKIIVEDVFSNEFREVIIDGAVEKIGAANFTWHGPYSFEVDSTTGDILSPYANTIRRLDRNTLNWTTVVGGGSSLYYSPATDGLSGSNVNLVSGYHAQTNGLINNKLYYQKYYWTGTALDGCFIKSYDIGNLYQQAHFMGTGSCATAINNGGLLENNTVHISDISKLNYFADPSDSVNKFFLVGIGTSTIFSGVPGGTINSFRNVGQNINSFTHKFDADGLNIYFCSTSGYLYKYIYNTSQTVALTWLSPTIKCKATRTIIYNSDRNSLIFPFTQNGLDGIAEYDLNP